MKEIISENFSKFASKYDRYAIFQKKSAQKLLKSLSPFIKPKNQKVLDIGAGTGELAVHFNNCTAIDISPKMCEILKRKGIKKVICCNAESLPFSNNTFHLVVSNYAAQWINLSKLFSETYRVLKKDGIFGLSLPVEGSLKELFTAWNKTFIKFKGKEDKLFQFPSINQIFYYSTISGFSILKFSISKETLYFETPSEALKQITKIGARNPYRKEKIDKKFYITFKRLYKEEKGFPITYITAMFILQKLD